MQHGDPISPDSQGAIKPVLKSRPDPIYPSRARRRGRQARVVVAVLVDEEGRVLQTWVKRGDDSGLGFNEAAEAAARHAMFAAATKDGIAGKMWTELSFDFRLE
jgi:TonB family protein